MGRILASEMEKDMVWVVHLSQEDKMTLIMAFHECYGNTEQSTMEFASEFYHLVNFINNGYLPTKLTNLVDWEETLIEWYPKYKDLLPQPPKKGPFSYITFTPDVKDPTYIEDKLKITADEHNHHGDIIDYNRMVPFEQIPAAVLADINNRYGYTELEDLETFKEELICRSALTIGLNEDRGYEVHCRNYYFYRLNHSGVPQFAEAQGEYGQAWINDVYEHLQSLNWNPTLKEEA